MTITVNGVEMTETDPKAIARAIAKAKREEAKADREREQRHDIAMGNAKDSAYRLYSWHGAKRVPDTVLVMKPHAQGSPVRTDGEYPSLSLTIEARGGTAPFASYRGIYRGCVVSGGGLCMAISLSDLDYPEVPPVLYAVGTHEGEIAIAACPGLSLEDFAHA